MKIIIITDAWHPQVNGVVTTYENISKELERLGHTVKVVGPSSFKRSIPMPGYPEIRLVLRPYNQLKRIIEDYQPDCIHVSAEGPLGWAGRKYCVKYNKRYTTTYHTHFPDYVAGRVAKYLPFARNFARNIARRWVKHFHAPSSRMYVATKSLEDDLLSWGFTTPIHRLTRGVNFDLFHPGEKTLFNDIKRPVALYVGRLALEKNLHDFLDMQWDGTKVLVGNGPSLKQLQKQYPAAVFAGQKTGEELAEYFRSADVFVFPSKTETFGIVLIEAMASGLPVAAFNVTGPKDLVTKPFLGVLNDDLSKASYAALECGTVQERFKYIKEHYTWEKTGQQFEAGLQPNTAENYKKAA